MFIETPIISEMTNQICLKRPIKIFQKITMKNKNVKNNPSGPELNQRPPRSVSRHATVTPPER